MGRSGNIAFVAALLLLGSCSGHTQQAHLTAAGELQLSEGFELIQLADSAMPAGSAGRLSLQIDELAAVTELHVLCSGAADLKSLYFQLNYDSGSYTLLEAQASGLLSQSAGSPLLELSRHTAQGHVVCGQVLANWHERSGFYGSGRLATLRFARRAELTAPRSISTPPRSEASSAPCIVSSGPGGSNMLLLYANSGDYNQDGLVGIADLTPLGQHFGDSGEFNLFDLRSIVDGDANGEINLADITPIGANFGNSALGGFNFYRSSSSADYPASAESTSTIAHFETLALSSLAGNPAEDRLAQSIDLGAPSPAAEYFWVRPLDGSGAEGMPGTLCLVPAAGSLTLTVLDPVVAGSGSEADPFVVEPSGAYNVQLIHSVDGDVTDSPFSSIGVGHSGLVIEDTPLPASYDSVSNTIDLVTGAEGYFRVFARYGSQHLASDLHFRISDPDNVEPTAFFTTDVTEGSAPFSVNCNAVGSTDSDGSVVRYEWDGDADGVYESIEFLGSYTAEISDGGPHEIFLRVVDDDGAVSDPVSRVVQSAGWLKTVAGNAGDTASPASPVLRVADGKPLIAYRSGPNLNVAYGNDSLGDDWGSISLSSAATPQQICLELINDRPALAWRRTASADNGIYYSISSNVQGTGFSPPVNVHSGDNNHSPSLAEIDGRPALAYAWDTGAGAFPSEVFYVRSLDGDGSDGGDWDLIGEGRPLFSAAELWLDRNSLQQVDTQVPSVDGRPGIFFISNNDEMGDNWQLRFIKATNNASTTWSFPGALQSAGAGSIRHFSVASIVSRPRFVYQNLDDSVTYRTCSDLAAEDWGSLHSVSDAGPSAGRGYFNSLANVAGFPALLHYDSESSTLRYVESGNATGEGGFGSSLDTVLPVGVVGEYDLSRSSEHYISLFALQGQPAMAYHDVNTFKLMFARYYELP